MITSNARAEFSTKTTIIVVLAWQPLQKAADKAGPPGLLRGGRGFATIVEHLTTDKDPMRGPAQEIFPRPRKI